jgi:hypothetical protein
MKSKPELKFLRILENIDLHFAFLFRRGFHVVSVLFFDKKYEDWQVTIAKDDCIIKVYCYIGKIGLTLSIPQLHYAAGVLELSELINGLHGNHDVFASAEEPPMNEAQSLEKLARLLENYLDQILEKIGRMSLLGSTANPSILSSESGQMSQFN